MTFIFILLGVLVGLLLGIGSVLTVMIFELYRFRNGSYFIKKLENSFKPKGKIITSEERKTAKAQKMISSLYEE